jgi:LPXTG-motif cell wall-anchored protein
MAASAADLEPATAELTSAPNQPAATETTAPAESNTTRRAETVVVATPAQEPEQTPPQTTTQTPEQTAPAAPTAAASDTSNDATGTMPKTASEIPLIALIGVCALALAGLFYLLRCRIIRQA